MIIERDIANMFGRHQMDQESLTKIDKISRRYELLALEILDIVPSSPEQTVCLRKLMESKRDAVYGIVQHLPLVE